MISLYVCSSTIHGFQEDQGPLLVEGVESHKPAYKVLRAVLKSNPHLNPDPNQIKLEDFALYKCHCDAYLDWIGDPSTYSEQQELESGDVQEADGVGGSAKGKEKEVDSMVDGQVDQPAVVGAMDPDVDISGPEQANVQATMENMLLGSEQELDPYQTLDQLELKDFARLFVRLRAQPPAPAPEASNPTSKKKRRAAQTDWNITYQESSSLTEPQDPNLMLQNPESMTSMAEEEPRVPEKRKRTQYKGNYVEGTDQTCLAAGRLAPEATGVRDSITYLLGGEAWMSQKVTANIPITTRDHGSLRALKKTIKQYMEMENLDGKTLKGELPAQLCKVMNKAYKKRQMDSRMKAGVKISEFQNLRKQDFLEAYEILVKQAERRLTGFPDPDAGEDDEDEDDAERDFDLAEHAEELGSSLSACRHISWLWKNPHWLTTPPLEGLKPITMNAYLATQLRSLATLTKLKAGEPAPVGGWPVVVQRALQRAMEQQAPKDPERLRKSQLQGRGWSQSRDVPLAISLLKRNEIEGFTPKPEDYIDIASGDLVGDQDLELMPTEGDEAGLFGVEHQGHHHHDYSDVEMIASASVHGMNGGYHHHHPEDAEIMGYPPMEAENGVYHDEQAEALGHEQLQVQGDGQDLGLGEDQRAYEGEHESGLLHDHDVTGVVDPNAQDQEMIDQLENSLGAYAADPQHHQQVQVEYQHDPNAEVDPANPSDEQPHQDAALPVEPENREDAQPQPRRSARASKGKRKDLNTDGLANTANTNPDHPSLHLQGGKVRQLDSDEETEIDLDEDGNPL